MAGAALIRHGDDKAGGLQHLLLVEGEALEAALRDVQTQRRMPKFGPWMFISGWSTVEQQDCAA